MQWTTRHDAKLRAYREQGNSFEQVAGLMRLAFADEAFTKDAVQKRFQGLTAGPCLRPLPAAEMMPVFRRYFDANGQPHAVLPKISREGYLRALASRDERVEILHISDLHVPLHDAAKLSRALRDRQGADLVVVGGDALEIYSYSRFPKKRNVPIEREIETWMRIQEQLATFPMVVIIDSNHLARIGAALGSVPPGLGMLVNPNLMEHLARPFPNIHVVPEWWTQVGDAIFAHGDYSKGRAPLSAWKVSAYFERFGRVGQLAVQPFRLLVQAHTHRIGTLVECGVKMIEGGCLAQLPLEYTTDQRAVAFTTPQTNGYVVVVQEHGRTLLNESREYFLSDDEEAASASDHAAA